MIRVRVVCVKCFAAFLICCFLGLMGCGGGNSSGGAEINENEPGTNKSELQCPSGYQDNLSGEVSAKRDAAEVGRIISSLHIAAVQNPIPVNIWQPDRLQLPDQINIFYLEYTANGVTEPQKQLFTSADAFIEVDSYGRSASIYAANEIRAFFSFIVSPPLELIEEGYYSITENDENVWIRQMDWYGLGCNLNNGWLSVDSVTYEGDIVIAVELRFELFCSGKLNGFVRWRADDTTVPPGPDNPIPDNLWRPADDVTQLSNNYVYLEAKPSDYFGQGYTHLYTLENSIIDLSTFDGIPHNAARLDLRIDAHKDWRAYFYTMFQHPEFEVGYYVNVGSWGDNPTKGSFSFECGTVSGWYVVDHVMYSDEGDLIEIDLRFEQYCGNADEPLHGALHWRYDDPTLPPGPQYPAPDILWQADPSIDFPAGNYVYIEGDEGDWLTNGDSFLFTSSNSLIAREESENDSIIYITVFGDYWTSGYLMGSMPLFRLEPGYYGPFVYGGGENINPAEGSLYWGFDHRSCSEGPGWFAIDDIAYNDAGQVSRLKARLEYRCEFDAAARVQIQWDESDKTMPPGPVNPVPSQVWRPDGSVPDCRGNYIYIEGDPNEFVSGGKGERARMLLGDVEATFKVYEVADSWEVTIAARSEPGAVIHIDGMFFQDKLEPGYYENTFNGNPAKGSVDVSVDSRSCNWSFGWFAVDEIAYYSDGSLANISVRFEQHCDSQPNKSLRGKAVWSAN